MASGEVQELGVHLPYLHPTLPLSLASCSVCSVWSRCYLSSVRAPRKPLLGWAQSLSATWDRVKADANMGSSLSAIEGGGSGARGPLPCLPYIWTRPTQILCPPRPVSIQNPFAGGGAGRHSTLLQPLGI